MSQSIDELGELYGTADVLSRLDISAWVLKKLVATGDFPAPFLISQRIKKWRKKDLDEWIRKRSQL